MDAETENSNLLTSIQPTYTVIPQDILSLWNSFSFTKRYIGPILVVVAALPLLIAAAFLNAPLALVAGFCMSLVLVIRETLFARPTPIGDFENMEATSVALRHDCFEVQSKSSLTLRSWKMIVDIQNVSAGIILHFSRYYRMIIPKRCFRDANAQQAFFELTRDQVSKSSRSISDGLPKLLLAPDPVSFSFASDPWSLAQQQNRAPGSEKRKSLGFIWSFLLVGFSPMVGTITSIILQGKDFNIIRELAFLAGFMVLLVVFQIVLGLIYRRLAFDVKASDRFDVRVDADHSGLEISIPGQTSYIRWEFVAGHRVLMDQSVAVDSMAGTVILLIPRSGFRDPSHRAEFIRFIEEQTAGFVSAELVTDHETPAIESGNPYQTPR